MKSSSTEYNFYNSDESRGQSILSSSSNTQPFKKAKDVAYYNNSLGIVKEVSNNTIEEDPEEENSSGKLVFPAELAQKEESNSNSTSSHKSEIDKVIDFMKDLTNRSEMIYSFYEEAQNQEVHEQELELAYLLNKICYDLKVFITTFASSKELRDDTGLQIISESNEKVDITESLIKMIKSTQEFKDIKESIVQHFINLSELVEKRHNCYMVILSNNSCTRKLVQRD